MRNKSISLTFIAVMLMAVAATTAFAYKEGWTGWFSSASFTYNRNTYTNSGSGGNLYDSTISTRDTFYLGTIGSFPLVYGTDTMWLAPATSMDSTSGGKSTGQTTTSGSGNWFCYGYVKSTSDSFTVWGTWSGTFTYPGGTPYYSASGTRTGSNGAYVTGGFSSSGTRFWYSP